MTLLLCTVQLNVTGFQHHKKRRKEIKNLGFEVSSKQVKKLFQKNENIWLQQAHLVTKLSGGLYHDKILFGVKTVSFSWRVRRLATAFDGRLGFPGQMAAKTAFHCRPTSHPPPPQWTVHYQSGEVHYRWTD